MRAARRAGIRTIVVLALVGAAMGLTTAPARAASDWSVTSTTVPATSQVNDTVTGTVTVANAVDGDALTGIALDVGASIAASTSFGQIIQTNTSPSSLAGGASFGLTFSARVHALPGGTNHLVIVVKATPGAGSAEAKSANAGTTTSTEAVTAVLSYGDDTGPSFSGDASTVAAGDQVRYTVTFSNDSDFGATLTSVTVPLPDGTSFFAKANGQPIMDAGDVTSYTLTVSVDSGQADGTLITEAPTATYSMIGVPDRAVPITPANVTSTVESAAVAIGPHTLTRIGGGTVPFPGDGIHASITVANTRDVDATAVVLTDTVANLSSPTALQLDGVACGAACVLGDHTITASLGTIPGHGSKTLTFDATVPVVPETYSIAAKSEVSVTFAGAVSPVTSGRFIVLGITPGAYQYVPVQRILDTRFGSQGPCIAAGAPRPLQVTLPGLGSLAGMAAVALHIAVTNATTPGWLTAYPTGSAKPATSAVNFGAGQTIANSAIVALSPNGSITLDNALGCAHVIVDIQGFWYGGTIGSPGSGGLIAMPPTRLLDTRQPGSGGCIAAGSPRTVAIGGVNGTPSSLSAVALNLTVTGPSAAGWVTAYPNGASAPGTSSINFVAGQTVGNATIVPVGTGGAITISNAVGCADVVLDATGTFTAVTGPVQQGGFNALVPTRALDTRQTGGCVAAGAPRNLTLNGAFGVPAFPHPRPVVTNITVTNPTSPAWLTVWAAGDPMPGTANVNFDAGQVVGNGTIAVTGTAGQVTMAVAAGCAHVVVDVVGWFSPLAT